MKQPYTENMQKLFKIFHRYKYLLLVVAVGIVLLLWPKSDGGHEAGAEEEYAAFSVEEMEKRLESALSQIEGAGRVKVILTLKSDMEIVLAQDTQTSQYREMEDGAVTRQESESEFRTVLSDGPVVVKRIYPQFQGILVICDGAKNPTVQLAIMESIAGLTGLKSNEITVASMKK